MSVNELITLYRPWFNILIPRSHESRMSAHCWRRSLCESGQAESNDDVTDDVT